jgi:hypothetical protein
VLGRDRDRDELDTRSLCLAEPRQANVKPRTDGIAGFVPMIYRVVEAARHGP